MNNLIAVARFSLIINFELGKFFVHFQRKEKKEKKKICLVKISNEKIN